MLNAALANSSIATNRFSMILVLMSAPTMLYLAWSVYTLPLGSVRVAAIMPFLLVAALFLNRALVVMQRCLLYGKAKIIRTIAHVSRWLATIVVPLVLTTGLNQLANDRESRLVEENFAPLLDYIERSIDRTGQTPADLSKYLENRPPRISFTYRRGDNSYMLETRGGSIDIDGATIFFSSEAKTWVRIHNNLLRPESDDSRSKAAAGYCEAAHALSLSSLKNSFRPFT